MKKGVLIAIEGIDASGKTTQSHMLYEKLRSLNLPVILSHEPTDSPIGEEIRRKLQEGSLSPEDAYTLFVKDRIYHVKNKIMPALQKGKIVIIDRYFISTMAYQGAAGISIDRIIKDHEKFAPLPDIIFIIDVPVHEAIKRLSGKENQDAYEKNEEFLKKVREIYLKMGRYLKTKVVILKGDDDVQVIHEQIFKAVLNLLKEKSYLKR